MKMHRKLKIKKSLFFIIFFTITIGLIASPVSASRTKSSSVFDINYGDFRWGPMIYHVNGQVSITYDMYYTPPLYKLYIHPLSYKITFYYLSAYHNSDPSLEPPGYKYGQAIDDIFDIHVGSSTCYGTYYFLKHPSGQTVLSYGYELWDNDYYGLSWTIDLSQRCSAMQGSSITVTTQNLHLYFYWDSQFSVQSDPFSIPSF